MVSPEEGAAAFVDLEYARIVDEKAAAEISSPKGTQGYAAPEVFKGEFTETSDIYALGLVYRGLLLNQSLKINEGALFGRGGLQEFTQDGPTTCFANNDAIVQFIYDMHYRSMPSLRPAFRRVEEFFNIWFEEYCRRRPDDVLLIRQYQEEAKAAEQERLNMLGDLWLRLPVNRVDAFWNNLSEEQLKIAARTVLEKQKNIPQFIAYFIQLKLRNNQLYQKIVKAFSANININDLRAMQDINLREFGKDLIVALSNAERARIFNRASINDFASLFYREDLPLEVVKQLFYIMQPDNNDLQLFINGLFEYQANVKAIDAKQKGVPFAYPYEKRIEDALGFINKYFHFDKNLHIKAILCVNKKYQEYVKKQIDSSGCCGGYRLFGRSESAKLKASMDLADLAERKPDEIKAYYDRKSIARTGKLSSIAVSLVNAAKPSALFHELKYAGPR